MEQKITYNKSEKLEELDDKIADILSEAVYSYIIRKGLLKRKAQPTPVGKKIKLLTNDMQI